jgi:hypothetical protein
MGQTTSRFSNVSFLGAGLRLERDAASLNLCCGHGYNLTLVTQEIANLKSNPNFTDLPLEKIDWTDLTNRTYDLCEIDEKTGKSKCGACTEQFWTRAKDAYNDTLLEASATVAVRQTMLRNNITN